MATLRRLTFELSPPELAESGLEAAVRSAAAVVFENAAVIHLVQTDGRDLVDRVAIAPCDKTSADGLIAMLSAL